MNSYNLPSGAMRYLENLLYSSNEFKNDIESLKNTEDPKKGEDELKAICKKYHIGRFFREMKVYVRKGYFAPLHNRYLMNLRPTGIDIQIDFDITKRDFDNIWKDVQSFKKSAFAKEWLKGKNVRKNKNLKDSFDTMLCLYRYKDKIHRKSDTDIVALGLPIEDERRIRALNKTQKSRMLKEIAECIEGLQ